MESIDVWVDDCVKRAWEFDTVDRVGLLCVWYSGTREQTFESRGAGISEMRIISGERRGHKFDGPRDDVTRPTSDLVRESIFNILGDAVDDRTVIDLYAGTGGLGLEALSRGASRAIFIDLKAENVALIHRNIATLRYEDRTSVIKTDAHRWARGYEPDDDAPMLVFIDPPYREYENHPDRVRQTLHVLLNKLPNGSVLVVESRSNLDDAVLPDLEAWDIRRYGGTQVAIRLIERPIDLRDDAP